MSKVITISVIAICILALSVYLFKGHSSKSTTKIYTEKEALEILNGKWDCEDLVPFHFHMANNKVEINNGNMRDFTIESINNNEIIISGIDDGSPLRFSIMGESAIGLSDANAIDSQKICKKIIE